MQDIPEVIESAQQVVTRAAVLRALTARHIEEHRQQHQHAYSAPPHFQFDFENFQQNGAHTVVGLIPMLMKVIHWLVTGTLVLTLSLLTYIVFYCAVMPARAASEPLYFDYTQTATPTFVYSPYQSDDIDAKTPNACFHPWAAIDLFAKHTAWDAIASNDVLPKPKAQTRVLDAGHAYYIETLLELPDSQFNRNSGMFGVVVELWSSNGTMLAVSRRSTRFPSASPWIDVLYKLVRILGFLVDALKETKALVLSSFSNFVESPDLPLRHVVVKILPWKDSSHSGRQNSPQEFERQSSPYAYQSSRTPPVEIIGGAIKIGKEHNAYQQVMKDWFFTCALIGTMSFAVWYVVFWHLLQLVLAVIREAKADNYAVDDEPPCDLDMDDDDFFRDFDDSHEVEENGEFSHAQQSADLNYRRSNPGYDYPREDEENDWEDLPFSGDRNEDVEGEEHRTTASSSSDPKADRRKNGEESHDTSRRSESPNEEIVQSPTVATTDATSQVYLSGRSLQRRKKGRRRKR